MDKKTAGSQILEHDAQRLELEDDIIEYRKSMEPEIMDAIYNTAHNAKSQDGYVNKNFYVVLLTTTDRVLKQPKIITLARKSCPTPVYKQSVWKFHADTSLLEFLWSIPDAILYYHLIRNKAQGLADKETADITKYVMLMENGELLKWVKRENGEKQDALIVIDHNEEEN